MKTQLVTQMNYPDLLPCKGINDCFRRILKEEGAEAFYRGLVPRLLNMVPMIGIQVGVYEVRANIVCEISLASNLRLYFNFLCYRGNHNDYSS